MKYCTNGVEHFLIQLKSILFKCHVSLVLIIQIAQFLGRIGSAEHPFKEASLKRIISSKALRNKNF